MKEILRAESIRKEYSGFPVLQDVSLTACGSECIGIFGPSCAGKSALLRILASVERPDAGAVTPAGVRVGISQQFPVLEEDLSLFEYLWLHSSLYEIPRRKRRSAVREALSVMEMDALRGRRLGTLSGSEKKLADIVRTLLCPCDILLFDEPALGLDWSMRAMLWDHLLRLRSWEKKTIVVATSSPKDADLCDRLLLLNRGRVIATGTLEALKSSVGPEALVITPVKSSGRRPQRVGLVEEDENGATIEIDPETKPVEILRQIKGHSAAMRLQPRTLDSILDELIASDKEEWPL